MKIAADPFSVMSHELRRYVRTYGKNSPEARAASIEFLKRAGIDPHFKYAVQRSLALEFPPKPEYRKPAYVEEWQMLLERADA